MHQCSKGCKWTTFNAAHCSSCHTTFASVGAFDRHRKNDQCREPETLGMRLNTRGAWSISVHVSR